MSEEVEKIKKKIMDYMKYESCSDGSCLFDDLEKGVPEIKDDASKEGFNFLHFTEPYQNINRLYFCKILLKKNKISEQINI